MTGRVVAVELPPNVTDRDVVEAVKALDRRRNTPSDRWRTGGSELTGSCTIYQGERFVGSVRRPEDAALIVAALNREAR